MAPKLSMPIGDDPLADSAALDVEDDLRDEADDFEDALIAEMTQKGAIEFW